MVAPGLLKCTVKKGWMIFKVVIEMLFKDVYLLCAVLADCCRCQPLSGSRYVCECVVCSTSEQYEWRMASYNSIETYHLLRINCKCHRLSQLSQADLPASLWISVLVTWAPLNDIHMNYSWSLGAFSLIVTWCFWLFPCLSFYVLPKHILKRDELEIFIECLSVLCWTHFKL